MRGSGPVGHVNSRLPSPEIIPQQSTGSVFGSPLFKREKLLCGLYRAAALDIWGCQ